MLYDGLFHMNNEDRVVPALAKEVSLSQDQKKYTFKLRESEWSNGEPLTARDFEETWKSLLDPQFPSRNANQFFMIKGAQAYKQGTGRREDVGIHSPNSYTLVVENWKNRRRIF